METQDASAEIMFKLWPWLEANRKRLIAIGGAAVAVFFIWLFISTQHQQRETAAGEAYTKLQLNSPATVTAQQLAAAYAKIASDYAGTVAAQRAQLQAGTVLYADGRYAEAQAAFQKFLAADSGGPLAPAAQLGVAASLEAQNKLDDALTAYHAVATSYPDAAETIPAKFAQGRVLELQGKLADAVTRYQDVARSQLAGSLAQEAAQRVAVLQAKLTAVKPTAKS
jgi:predicted negative regulator of RcsB-dependent stress response